MDNPHPSDQHDDTAGMTPDPQPLNRWILHLDQLDNWQGWRVGISPETPLLPGPGDLSPAYGSDPADALERMAKIARDSAASNWTGLIIRRREAQGRQQTDGLLEAEHFDALTGVRTSASIDRAMFDTIAKAASEKGWL